MLFSVLESSGPGTICGDRNSFWNCIKQLENKLREVSCKEKEKIIMADLMQRIMELIRAEQAAKGGSKGGSNNGTSDAFNNYGSGPQEFGGATINSGQGAGNRNRFKHSEHYGGKVMNNSGTFNGNGNGGTIEGGFDSSTNNYYR
ncbi:hypothetical protein VNO80_29461 [Phaseolus coccineus]|uniref:Uncharacterized protein n=1 Tax=Phaseolus coccineus TaxID=3886 RepID=A0AAN9QF15_PHACN